MLPRTANYAVWPSVVPADVPTEMTVIPTERAFLLFEGESYTVTVITADADELDYHVPSTATKYTCKAHDGVLRFTHTFPEEGEHLILLTREGKKPDEMAVYSLREDLYRLLPFRADFHSHSYRSDGKRDPAALAGHFREQGYDTFALTDHNRFYPGGEIDEVYAGVKCGLHRTIGEEVHAPGGVAHIVHVCGKESVTEMYLKDIEGYQKQIKDTYLSRVPEDIPEAYKERYAIAMWVTERIHRVGGLAIFAHPYWRPAGSRVHNVREELARIFLKSGMFDAYEVIGGMGQSGVNRSIALWQEMQNLGYNIPVVGSSDVHNIDGAYSFPHYFTICFAESTDDESIRAAILAGNTVAVEATGTEYAREYRAYGKHRLVTFAQFLFRHFFPHYWRLTQGEGVAMRAYAMGEADASLISLQAELAESYRDRFFGRRAPVLPSKEMLAFENKWRERHLQGPKTKGSTILTDDVTVQI